MRLAISSSGRIASSELPAQLRNWRASWVETDRPTESTCRTRRANSARAESITPGNHHFYTYLVVSKFEKCQGRKSGLMESYPECLGGHLKTGHTWTLQKRPMERNQNKSICTLRDAVRARLFRMGCSSRFIPISPGRRTRQRRDASAPG